ncbi:BTB/POZ domain-containing protein At4g08455-like [Diospyros lotus]|uniref:BTB/POZ domain-containing protein At4g08455-like n=1 Tax=Diospyros lotus TaxID=55363 RepID=UPI00225B7C75|nr:BTB/POZ domain-containing protein At4g08455-like [Diospyros lotus]
MKCRYCKKDYRVATNGVPAPALKVADSGACGECYEKAIEAKEELKHENDDLKAKVAFLSLPPGLHLPSFSDVVLVASDDGLGHSNAITISVPAHRAVLASRSPVFRAMFENEMEESLSGTIKIGDVSCDALRSFVNYLYTAEASLDEQMAIDLLVLAEKYRVKHLKTYCENYKVSELNWENALKNFVFARQHNAKILEEAALLLIMDNMEKLSKCDVYMELVEKDPRLVVEIYEAYHSEVG